MLIEANIRFPLAVPLSLQGSQCAGAVGGTACPQCEQCGEQGIPILFNASALHVMCALPPCFAAVRCHARCIPGCCAAALQAGMSYLRRLLTFTMWIVDEPIQSEWCGPHLIMLDGALPTDSAISTSAGSLRRRYCATNSSESLAEVHSFHTRKRRSSSGAAEPYLLRTLMNKKAVLQTGPANSADRRP